jgi:hypothetical protein
VKPESDLGFGLGLVSGRVNQAVYAPSDPSILYLASPGGGIWRSSNAGTTWTPTSNTFTWAHQATSALAVDPDDPNIVYVGTGDSLSGSAFGFGMLKTVDGGRTWNGSNLPGTSISQVLIEPGGTVSARNILAATTNGIFLSQDSGATWAVTTLTSATGFLGNDANVAWTALDMGAPSPSTNAQDVFASGEVIDTSVTPNRTLAVFAISHDKGITWTVENIPIDELLPPSLLSGHAFYVAASKVTQGTAYVLAGLGKQVWRTIDSGANWVNVTSNLSFDAATPRLFEQAEANDVEHYSITTTPHFVEANVYNDTIYLGSTSLWESDDSARTWHAVSEINGNVPIHENIHWIAQPPSNLTSLTKQLLLSTDGGVYASTIATNATSTYTSLNGGGLNIAQVKRIDLSNTGQILGGAKDIGTLYFNPISGLWSSLHGGDGGWTAFDSLGDIYTFATNFSAFTSPRYGLYRYPAGSSAATNILASVPALGGGTNQVSPPFVVTTDNRLYLGPSVIDSWLGSWTGNVGNLSSTPFTVLAKTSVVDTLYAGNSNAGDVFYGTNLSKPGAAWVRISDDIDQTPGRGWKHPVSILAITASPTDPRDVLVAISAYVSTTQFFPPAVYHCANVLAPTRTWINVTGFDSTVLAGGTFRSIARDPDDPNRWYLGTDTGVFVTPNQGQNWYTFSFPFGLPSVSVNELRIVKDAKGVKTMYAGTDGLGIWKISLTAVNLAGLELTSVTPNPIVGTQPGTAMVTLTVPPSNGGAFVSLTSNNGCLTVPASVIVPQNQENVTFNFTTTSVAADTVATITAHYGTNSATLPITVQSPRVLSLTLTPSVVPGGQGVTAAVVLDEPVAPGGGGLTVSLGGSTIVAAPSTVIVPTGSTTTSFTIHTAPVVTIQKATISVKMYNSALPFNAPISQVLTVDPAHVISVSINPSAVTGGVSSTATIQFDTIAPTGGATVSLTSNKTAATIQSSVVIPVGQSTVTVPIKTVPVVSDTPVTITAKYLASSNTGVLTVLAPQVLTVTLTKNEIVGGNGVNGMISLTGNVAKTVLVNLASSDPITVQVPALVSVTTGKQAVFGVKTIGVGAATTVTISANVTGGATQTTTLLVDPASLVSFAFAPTTILAGQNITGVLTLNGLSPTGGSTATLSSGNPGAVIVPGSVSFASQSQQLRFTAATGGVDTSTTVTVTATYNGGSKTASVTVVPAILIISLTTTTPAPGATFAFINVRLNGPAGPSGTPVKITCSDSSLVQVQNPTIVIGPGSTSATDTLWITHITAATSVTLTATTGSSAKSVVMKLLPGS